MKQLAGFILHPTPVEMGIKRNEKGRGPLSRARRGQSTTNT